MPVVRRFTPLRVSVSENPTATEINRIQDALAAQLDYLAAFVESEVSRLERIIAGTLPRVR